MNFKDKLKELLVKPESLRMVEVDGIDEAMRLLKFDPLHVQPVRRESHVRPTVDKVFGDPRKFYPRRIAYRSAKELSSYSFKAKFSQVSDYFKKYFSLHFSAQHIDSSLMNDLITGDFQFLSEVLELVQVADETEGTIQVHYNSEFGERPTRFLLQELEMMHSVMVEMAEFVQTHSVIKGSIEDNYGIYF